MKRISGLSLIQLLFPGVGLMSVGEKEMLATCEIWWSSEGLVPALCPCQSFILLVLLIVVVFCYFFCFWFSPLPALVQEATCFLSGV